MDQHIWESDKHIQINEFHMDSMEDFRTYWKNLQDKYIGFTIDFCYHNCYVPIDYMQEINATILESCIETRLAKENYIPTNDYELTYITSDNFTNFAVLHDDKSSGMYWTSERLQKDLSRWVIYTYMNNYILMYLGDNISEIFALEAKDKKIGEALISKASEYSFKARKTGVLRMVDDNALLELEMVKSVGFVVCGNYICYQTIIK